MEETTTIIPIASGKGGVGKTLVAANLAIGLARLGHSTLAVDLDLGGSNLYTCLGVPNKHPGIGDYLKTGGLSFENLAVPTRIPNLAFIPGEGRTPFMANISHEQRMDLVREVKKLKARYVVLDLGAGTSLTTLNFFGVAPRGILVTTFETPAIMNLVMFLRNFIFRVISGVSRQDGEVFALVLEAFRRSIQSQTLTVESLLGEIRAVNPRMAEKVERAVRIYRPRIVFNMGDHPDELAICPKLQNTLGAGLSMEADFLGFIFHDDAVRRSAKNREVLLARYPQSPASKGIIRIAQRMVRFWDSPGLDGFDLGDSTAREYAAWIATQEAGAGGRAA